MAHLWKQDTEAREWAASPLTGSAYGVSGHGLSLLEDHDGGHDGAALLALLVRCDNEALEQWFLLARKQASVQVNGWPLVLGVRLLCDRDEIVVQADGSPTAFHCFFSTERLARIVAYPGGDGTVRCPRCKEVLEQNQMAVRCPNVTCGAWHHQDQGAERPCWCYSDRCALCDQPTELDAGFRWTPEAL